MNPHPTWLGQYTQMYMSPIIIMNILLNDLVLDQLAH